jgi:hypothetical protein
VEGVGHGERRRLEDRGSGDRDRTARGARAATAVDGGAHVERFRSINN